MKLSNADIKLNSLSFKLNLFLTIVEFVKISRVIMNPPSDDELRIAARVGSYFLTEAMFGYFKYLRDNNRNERNLTLLILLIPDL